MKERNDMVRLSLVASVIIAVLFWNCSTGSITGNSSETTDGLIIVSGTGKIEGTAPPFSSLYLFEDTYDPFSGTSFDSLTTDTTGTFFFQVSKAGYNLICRTESGMGALVHLDMIADLTTSDTIREPLSSPGSVEGYTSSRKDENVLASYLCLKGTPFYSIADSLSGYFRIEDIPQGRYNLVLYFKVYITDTITTYQPDSLESTMIITIVSDSVLTLGR